MVRLMGTLPIRKIGANRVGLASYYGKTFIDRATKKANSSLAYVLARLSKATISPDDHLREVSPGNVFDNYFKAPYIYAGISESYQTFNAGNLHIDVNPKGFRATLDPKILAQLEVNGARVAGHSLSGKKSLVIVDNDNNFHTYNNDGLQLVGDIYTVLQLDKRLAPIDYAEVKIFSKSIPVGIYLARIVGFRKLVKLLGATHRLVEGKQQKNLQPYEYAVQFKDFAYVFDSRQQVNSLILAGFHAFEKETRLFNAEMFDSPGVYLRLLESKGLNVAYMREMESLQDMFIDPITERILKEMNEPTTFNGLLIRSCELLKTYYYPASQDLDYQRIRGYDRFPGFFYKELVNSIRAFKQKNSTGRAKVDMAPFQLWTTITRDATVKHIEDINPIQSLKITQEAVTYVGEGGRGKESMNRESRAFLISDMGIDAGDSIDSGDVGVNVFKSANPIFDTIDGIKDKKIPIKDLTPSNLLSTSVLMSPFALNDDRKRIAFIGIQQAHTVASEGYSSPMVRTGYESVIGMRTGEMFAKAATQDGTVTNVTDKGITVKYKDGTEKGYALGILYGKAEGSVYPHPLVTDMKSGQKFKKGDYLTYNKNFFEKDPLFKGSMVYKGSLMARVAMVELPETHEDSSTISEGLSARLRSTVTKVKTYTVNFKQNIHNVVKVGQKVRPEDIIMTIEDEITAMDDSLSSNSLDILSERSKNSPRSGYVGQISDIEVIYHGLTEDMSTSLKNLVNQSNRNKAKEAASRLKTATTGSTDSEYTVDGVPLGVDKAVIKVYINVSDNASSGDKLVFANQLKSVIGEVMNYTMRTENGDIVDAKMGAKSFAARIVRSTVMIGERANALHAIAMNAVKIYQG